ISSTKLSAYNTKFYSNKVYENEAYRDGGGIYIKGFSPIIYNSLIVNNTSTDDGGGIYDTNSVSKYYNCTIADNNADEGGGYFSPNTSASSSFYNDIVWDNSPDDVEYNGNPPNASSGKYSYCDIGSFTNMPNNYNINANPKFTTYNGIDYLPSNISTPTSPCINSGDNIPGFFHSTYDLRGTPYLRTVNQIDMGAYEYPANGSYKIAKTDSSNTVLDFDNIMVFPNPVESYYNIRLISETKCKVEIMLINSFGKNVYSSELLLVEGDNLIQFQRGQLSDGIYYLKINSAIFDSKFTKIIFK
ncbi:MAG: T9SS type A sorting domain-containing protein, partial [Bacteroidota bacterium]|nr:T9SS type A sorting domain-containing protein [Bacteroidota bacterium]